jgi:hypothetical protein
MENIIDFIEKYVVVKLPDGTTAPLILNDAGKAFLSDISSGYTKRLPKIEYNKIPSKFDLMSNAERKAYFAPGGKWLKNLFKYSCKPCGYLFDNPEVETDDVNDEQIDKCPWCKSEQIELNDNGI